MYATTVIFNLSVWGNARNALIVAKSKFALQMNRK